MKKTKLKIHTSHLVCGSRKFDLYNIKKLSDIFLIKKHKGITIDITKFNSETIEIEYDESKNKNLFQILKKNSCIFSTKIKP